MTGELLTRLSATTTSHIIIQTRLVCGIVIRGRRISSGTYPSQGLVGRLQGSVQSSQRSIIEEHVENHPNSFVSVQLDSHEFTQNEMDRSKNSKKRIGIGLRGL